MRRLLSDLSVCVIIKFIKVGRTLCVFLNLHTAINLLILLCFLSGSCSDIKTSPGSVQNDSPPQGTLIAQGGFNGLNGKSVTGNAYIYLTQSLEYVLRLESFTVPNEPNLKLLVKGNGNVLFTKALDFTSGTKNYNLNLSPPITWNAVIIESQSTTEYGNALLVDLKSR